MYVRTRARKHTHARARARALFPWVHAERPRETGRRMAGNITRGRRKTNASAPTGAMHDAECKP
eukprot:4770037-Alexandrium_andersonii.AAC.1